MSSALAAQPAEPSPAPSRGLGWLWALPWVATALVLVATGALLWLLHVGDEEDQRATLISDVLWVEQTLQFQLDHNAEILARLGSDAVSGEVSRRDVDARLRSLLSNDGLVGALWLDASGAVVRSQPSGEGAARAVPDGAAPSDPEAAARHTAREETARLARSAGKPVYSGVYRLPSGEPAFEVIVPLPTDAGFEGWMVGVYALRELLRDSIPWWFVEKYQVAILDASGARLAAKSNVAGAARGAPYQILLDPPGHGLVLQVALHRSGTRLVPALLMSSIVALAAAIVVSVWALRRHARQRLDAERALREAHAFRKAMEDSLLTGMRARDREGRITYVNPAFCRMVGWSAEELIGLKPPMPYWAPEAQEETFALNNRVLSGRASPQGMEARFRRRDGERFDALIYEAPLIDAHGRHTGWMGSVLDVTERRRADERERAQQERLQATARLVALGELASTLAHEVNQPLSAIASYSAGCLNRMETGSIAREELAGALGKIQAQAQRAGQIIRRVHEFVRRGDPNWRRAAVNDLVDEALGLLEPMLGKAAVRLVRELDPEAGEVEVEPVMVEQVLVNLVRNAVDAMSAAGPDARELLVRTARGGNGVRVTIGDRGPGLAPEVAAKLFTPFFTTKPEGMGMGLSICRSIVELHKGQLWHEPRPGGGTLFSFTLART